MKEDCNGRNENQKQYNTLKKNDRSSFLSIITLM